MVFRFFSSGKKRTPLTGTPAVRRLKNYSARSGYVYQYYYEGYRPSRDQGTEFVFSVSGGRTAWREVRVAVSGEAIREWERKHAREVAANERYALAKMSLFQAFDEEPRPADLKEDVRVSAADIERLSETLGL